ncbi:MAG: 3-deoxy-D-manno-octulosonic acid transferase [Gammaproteobacteria bacterium]|nr:3-deoxy-D-manno-octulosonic acid transferase [Gammaproteobacteria bacterium]
MKERLGLYRWQSTLEPIWIHAASVGEVIAIEPLIHCLLKRFPERSFIISTGTPTGARVARQRLPGAVKHVYLPIDLPGAVHRFLDHLTPTCALIMETELWFNLYKSCATRDIPIVVINGRLSSRTLNARVWLRSVYMETIARVDAILARSAKDKEGFIALGASPDRVKVIGNIKFAAPTTTTPFSKPMILRPYVLVASTHENEELRFLRLWKSRERHQYLLVIAPRHPHRLKDILKQIAPLSEHVSVRSRDDITNDHTEVYLVDTLGELAAFMARAEIVFMGGSLVPHGGHNILEPARLGKPIVFGPHMDNFADEARIFLEHEAAIQITDDDALDRCLARLLESREERDQLGERAKSVVRQYEDIAERYVDEIAGQCNLSLA